MRDMHGNDNIYTQKWKCLISGKKIFFKTDPACELQSYVLANHWLSDSSYCEKLLIFWDRNDWFEFSAHNKNLLKIYIHQVIYGHIPFNRLHLIPQLIPLIIHSPKLNGSLTKRNVPFTFRYKFATCMTHP